MEPTIFEKIIAREVPADIVYEDEETIAFLDIAPNNPGHTLVVPKQHSRNLLDIDEASWLAVMKTVRLLAPVIRKAVGADGINIAMNNEPAAAQVVFHTHIHIIPRYTDDGFKTFPPGTYKNEHQAKEIAEKIRALV